MNRKQYFEFHQECVNKMTETTKKKNADYAGPGNDPFANFTRVESLGICSTEQGFLTRMTDKMSRLSSFVQVGKLEVLDESVEDTLLDLANYAILMAGYIKSKSSEETPLQKMAKEYFPENDFMFTLDSEVVYKDGDSMYKARIIDIDKSSTTRIPYRITFNVDSVPIDRWVEEDSLEYYIL